MTLEEVIEKLTAESEVALRTGRRELYVALGIGIRAIELVQHYRQHPVLPSPSPLPGETTE